MNAKRFLLVILSVLTLTSSIMVPFEPAAAWYRGGYYHGGWGGRPGWGGGCRWGGCGGGDVGAGIAAGVAGLAIGALAGAAISSATGGYPGYGCVRHPIYNEWGGFAGYSC